VRLLCTVTYVHLVYVCMLTLPNRACIWRRQAHDRRHSVFLMSFKAREKENEYCHFFFRFFDYRLQNRIFEKSYNHNNIIDYSDTVVNYIRKNGEICTFSFFLFLYYVFYLTSFFFCLFCLNAFVLHLIWDKMKTKKT